MFRENQFSGKVLLHLRKNNDKQKVVITKYLAINKSFCLDITSW